MREVIRDLRDCWTSKGNRWESLRTTLNVWIVEKSWPRPVINAIAVIEWNMRDKQDRV